MELFAIAIVFIIAWRVPVVFDYIIIAPFIGTGVGLFVWSLFALFDFDVWSRQIVGVCILLGIFCTGAAIGRFRNVE